MDKFVFHKNFGLGLVLDYSGNFTKVLFLNYGTKSIVNSFLQTIPSNLINDVINFKFNNNYNFKEKLMTEYENTVFSCFNDDEIYSVDLTFLEDNYALFHLQRLIDLLYIKYEYDNVDNTIYDNINNLIKRKIIKLQNIKEYIYMEYTKNEVISFLDHIDELDVYKTNLFLSILFNYSNSLKNNIDENVKNNLYKNKEHIIKDNINKLNNIDKLDFNIYNCEIILYLLFTSDEFETYKYLLEKKKYDSKYVSEYLKYYLPKTIFIDEVLKILPLNNLNVKNTTAKCLEEIYPYNKFENIYKNSKLVYKILNNLNFDKLPLSIQLERLVETKQMITDDEVYKFIHNADDFYNLDKKKTLQLIARYKRTIARYYVVSEIPTFNNKILDLIINSNSNFYTSHKSIESVDEALEFYQNADPNDFFISDILNFYDIDIKINKTLGEYSIEFRFEAISFYSLSIIIDVEKNRIEYDLNWMINSIKNDLLYTCLKLFFENNDINQFLEDRKKLKSEAEVKEAYDIIDKFNYNLSKKDTILLNENKQIKLYFNIDIKDDDADIDLKASEGDERAYTISSFSKFIEAFKNNEVISYGKYLTFQHNLKNLKKPFDKAVSYLSKIDYNRSYYSKIIRVDFDELYDILDILKGEKVAIKSRYIFDISDYNKSFDYLVVNDDLDFIAKIDKDGILYFNDYISLNVSYEKTIILDENLQKIYLLSGEKKILFDVLTKLKNKNVLLFKDKFINNIYSRFSEYFIIDESLKDVFIINELNIKAYFDYDNDIITVNKKYFINNEEINSNINEYDHNHALIRFDNYLANLGFVNDILKDSNLIINFFMLDFSEMKKLADVYLSDNILNKQIIVCQVPTIKMNYNSGIMNCFLEDSPYSDDELREIIKAMKKKKKFILLKDDKILAFNDDDMQFGDVVSELGLLDNDDIYDKVELPLYQTFKMIATYNNIKVDDFINEMLNDIKNYKYLPLDLPNVCAKLRDYQVDAYKWLKVLNKYHLGGILADDMGLGKTLEIITLLNGIDLKLPVLIVTPKSLIYNWISEFNKFSPNTKVCSIYGMQNDRKEIIDNLYNDTIYITSYDSLYRDIKLYENKEFSYLILDEAQAIKNALAEKTKAVKKIKSQNKLALTGTPIENNIYDLWSIFDFLMPKFFPGINRFNELYKDNTTNLALKVTPFILRRTKKEVLKDLPEKFETIMSVDLTNEEKKIYDSFVLQAKDILSTGGKSFDVLYLLTRLRQVCISPSLVDAKFNKESSKLKLIKDTIIDYVANDHKILVFSAFVEALNLISDILNENKIKHYMLTGDTKATDRLAMATEFNANNKIKVFLISLKAGGVGLNLIGADTVIHVDPWWNVAAENQASDRAHRIGQVNNVEVIKMIINDSIEQRVIELQNIKKDLIDKVINNSDEALTKLSREDLNFILN